MILARNEYYSCRELQDLFRILEVNSEEVVGENFDDVMRLVYKRYRKLSLQCHPDKESTQAKKDIATKKFQELSVSKDKLIGYLNVLKGGKSLSCYRELAEEEAKRRQKKIDDILSRMKRIMIGISLSYIFISGMLNPSKKIECCLLKFATSNIISNVIYKFFVFYRQIWPLLYITYGIWLIYTYIARRQHKEESGQEESYGTLKRKLDILATVNRCLMFIAGISAVCSVGIAAMKNSWHAYYGTLLMVNLVLDLLLFVLFRAFIKGLSLYSEYCIECLFEDIEFSYRKDFAWYEPYLVLVPIILPIIKVLFSDLLEGELQTKLDNCAIESNSHSCSSSKE